MNHNNQRLPAPPRLKCPFPTSSYKQEWTLQTRSAKRVGGRLQELPLQPQKQETTKARVIISSRNCEVSLMDDTTAALFEQVARRITKPKDTPCLQIVNSILERSKSKNLPGFLDNSDLDILLQNTSMFEVKIYHQGEESTIQFAGYNAEMLYAPTVIRQHAIGMLNGKAEEMPKTKLPLTAPAEIKCEDETYFTDDAYVRKHHIWGLNGRKTCVREMRGRRNPEVAVGIKVANLSCDYPT